MLHESVHAILATTSGLALLWSYDPRLRSFYELIRLKTIYTVIVAISFISPGYFVDSFESSYSQGITFASMTLFSFLVFLIVDSSKFRFPTRVHSVHGEIAPTCSNDVFDLRRSVVAHHIDSYRERDTEQLSSILLRPVLHRGSIWFSHPFL